jgi:catechol 2,3-dioxygenase-like lactoylglutathione lyase family enzyme
VVDQQHPDTVKDVTIERMEHVGILVDDLAAARDFFVDLGFEVQGEFAVEGDWVDASWDSTAFRWMAPCWRLRTATDGSSW